MADSVGYGACEGWEFPQVSFRQVLNARCCVCLGTFDFSACKTEFGYRDIIFIPGTILVI
jgi:hypothetical protein